MNGEQGNTLRGKQALLRLSEKYLTSRKESWIPEVFALENEQTRLGAQQNLYSFPRKTKDIAHLKFSV